jgi:AAA ATPase domain
MPELNGPLRSRISRDLAPVDRTLLEREAELGVLLTLIEAALEGDGRLAVVEGSTGIGKTRLLSEMRPLAAGAGFEVMTARAGEFEGDFAFGVVRQLFEPALAAAASDLRAELLSGAAELSAPLFALAGPHAAGAASEDSFAMLHGLYWLAANFALRKPTMLVVDDLHWADERSLRWLGFLASSRRRCSRKSCSDSNRTRRLPRRCVPSRGATPLSRGLVGYGRPRRYRAGRGQRASLARARR